MSRELHDNGAEQSVLGGLLLANDAFDVVGDELTEVDFYDHQHRLIYRATTTLIGEGKPADAITVGAALEQAGNLGRVGGLAYVAALVANVPTAASIRQYARIIRERRIERDLVAVAGQITALAHGVGPIAERLADAQSAVFALAEAPGSSEPLPLGASLPATIDAIESRINGGASAGIPTGIEALDRKLGGLRPGDEIVIAARTSIGKTALALQIGLHNAMAQRSVLVFSLEMDRGQLAERSLSHVGRIDGERIRRGDLEPEDWERLAAALGRINKAPLIVDDRADLNVAQMRARARRVKRKHGLDLVIVDYLQLMRGDGDNRNEQVSGISRGLKLMARELGVPVIALSQLNRKVEDRTDKRPLLSDLRDSGAVEQDADVILLIYRDEVYNPGTAAKGIAELLIRKNRMGRTGDVLTEFRGEFNEFRDTDWRPAPADVRPLRRPRSFG